MPDQPSSNSLPTGTVTFLFTDIQGSTPMWEREPEKMAEALQVHNTALRQAIEAHGGAVFKTVGDAFQAAFATAPQALKAAIEGQRNLQTAPWNELGALSVRMGLHTGEAELDPGGDEYAVCHAKNRIGRIHSAAHGGQVLLSQETADLVLRVLPEGISLKNLGEHRLKGMQWLEHLYQVVAPDLSQEFPPLATAITHPNNLPVQLTSFIGREKEIAAVVELLGKHRLVTLSGVGGVGKTRLSLQVARSIMESFPDGVWFIEFAPLIDPDRLSQTVAGVLGLQESGSLPILDVMIQYLQSRSLLLVLDNCEHLIDACAGLVDTLLRNCDQIKLLATSREALSVTGEVPYHVPSLSFPKPLHQVKLDELSQCEAVRLFITRAAVARTGFTLTEPIAPAVAQICQRLDGIPLAIELAAARTGALSVEQIATRLNNCFRLLTGGSRTSLPRHQTLRASIDWSYTLLDQHERSLLVRLTVFSGGWTLEAAETVCGFGELVSSDIVNIMTSLVNKSLIVVDRDAFDIHRYHMLETVRQYGRERLIDKVLTNQDILDCSAEEQVRQRHLDYYLQLAEQAETGMVGKEQRQWFRWIKIELDNIRTALEWSLEDDLSSYLRLASSLQFYWFTTGIANEGCTWLKKGLDRVDRTDQAETRQALRAKALGATGILLWTLGNADEASQYLKESAALYRSLGQSGKLAYILSFLGLSTNDERFSMAAEAVELARQSGDAYVLAESLHHQGVTLQKINPHAAQVLFEESASLFDKIGNRLRTASVHRHLGYVYGLTGRFEEGRLYFEKALVVDREFGCKWYEMYDLLFLGEIAYLGGQYTLMVSCFSKTLKISQEIGVRWIRNRSLQLMGQAARRQGKKEQIFHFIREILEVHRDDIDNDVDAEAIALMAGIALDLGQPLKAVHLMAVVETQGLYRLDNFTSRPEYDHDLTAAKAALTEEDFRSAWEAGQAMTLKQAVALALEEHE
jgi:predicted ATPase/class 3 adenylate cyclase